MEYLIIFLLVAACLLAMLNLAVSLNKKNARAPDAETERRLIALDMAFGKFDALLREEFARNREESGNSSRENRDELSNSFNVLGDTLRQTISILADAQKQQFELFANQQEGIRRAIDIQLKDIREESAKKLEDMRKTVDENLKDAVEKRFSDSFKMISERLEQVHKGLGEMQQLALGVGDLKRVFTNVKTRGNLGEIQLGAILEQILSPDQYEPQKTVKAGQQERVDYAIKLPDKNSMNKTLLLPIDSKFPTEDYLRLLDAYESSPAEEEMKRLSAAFESSVRKCAKDIHDKYISPPQTTDFAIMFVPSEGLYAEIVRRAGLFESLQRNCKVTVVGPTNLSAFLSSLQMGFRTLAIERRSSEVWELLGAIKAEFGKFGNVLDSIKKKIDSASQEINNAGIRSKAIECKLRAVEELPLEQSQTLLKEGVD
jgi:DNA recombination protein RmuC